MGDVGMARLVQRSICCPCGNDKVLALGLCATCYTLKRQDEAYFGGLREQVLERDGIPAEDVERLDGESAPLLSITGFPASRSFTS